MGTEGVVRKRTVGHLFNKIIQIAMPSYLKYLTWSLEQEFSPFKTKVSPKNKRMQHKIQLKSEKRNNARSAGVELEREKEHFAALAQNLFQLKTQIL